MRASGLQRKDPFLLAGNSFLRLRQEVDGSPQGKQLGFSPCGRILQDENSRTIKRRLGPAQIENKTPHMSHS